MSHKPFALDFTFIGFGAGKYSNLESFDRSLNSPGASSDDSSDGTSTSSGGPSSSGATWNSALPFNQMDLLSHYATDGYSTAYGTSGASAADAEVESFLASQLAAGGGSGGGGGSTTVSTSGSGLVFVNTYDASCTAAFEACIVSAEDELESLFSNSDTIKIEFSETDSASSGFYSTNTWSSWTTVNYSQLKAALPTSDVLPATDPNPTGTWYLPEAYARMLGLNSSTPSEDMTVALNTYYNPDFGQDVINAMIHEISEGGLGRVGGTGDQNGVWSTMDLFRYTSAGVLDDSDGRDGDTTYFSSNGGVTASDTANPSKGAPTLSFNNEYNSSGKKVNGDDTADWVQNAVFGSTGSGETLTLNQAELEVMQALGWNLTLKQDVYEDALGGWETGDDWSTGSMPITAQDAYVGGVNGDMLVTLNSNVQIHSIATSADADFAIGNDTAVTLDAIYGTVLNTEDSSSVASGNLGKLAVEAGSALQVGGTFDNGGTLAVGKGAGGTGNTGYLYIYDTFGATTLDGGGTVDLGQLADPSDDEIQLKGDILNAPGTSGNGLINVDDTITGGGLISLGSFDNQADGAVDASQTGGFWLQVSATTFSNEGFFVAEDGSTLDLGADGVSETLTNTGNGETSGAVNIDAGGRLAISGNFTIAGSGAVSFKGAGSELTSDGSTATFTNDSTVGLGPSIDSNSAFSGQLGDASLTYVNNGTTYASGSGYALTINTGAHVVTNGANGIFAAENGGLLNIVSSLVNDNIIDVGTSSSSSVGATTGTVDLGSETTAESLSSSGSIFIYASSNLEISGHYTNGSSSETWFEGAGAELSSDGAAATLTNDGYLIAVANGQIGDQGVKPANDLTLVNAGTIIASGAGVTLTLDTGANILNDGGGLMYSESGGTLLIESNVHTGQSSAGSPPGGTVEAYIGGIVELTKTISNGVAAPSVAGQVVIDGGTFEMLAGSQVKVPIEFTGGGTLEILRNNATVTVSGSDGDITAKGDDVIAYKSGTGLTVTGKGVTVNASSGTGLTIGANSLAGPQDIVNGSHVSVSEHFSSDVAVNGSSDTIALLSGAASALTVAGNANAITALKNDVVSVLSGANNSVTGTSSKITIASGLATKIFGTGNTVQTAADDSLTDGGVKTEFVISGNVDALTILTFKADPTGVIDLLNGVGGYATAAAAYAALTTDHAGGSLLSLGSSGSIDFKGDPVADLSASNFKIG